MEIRPLGPCPQCRQGWVIQGKYNWNCTRWKEGCPFKIPPVLAQKTLTPSQIRRLLKKGNTPPIKGFQGKHGPFDAALRLTSDFQIEFVFSEEPAIIGFCPQCDEGRVVKLARFYGCDQASEGCDFKIWKTIAQKRLKDAQVKALLKEGQTPLIKGFKGRYGKFNAVLHLGEQGEVVFEYVD